MIWKNTPKLEVTTKVGCKVQCRYCPQDIFVQKYQSCSNPKMLLSFNDYCAVLDKLPKDIAIIFAGYSEPYLNPECSKMIKYAYNQGRKVSLFTTLVGMTLADVEVIKDVDFEELVLHIPDKYGYAKIPVNNEYKQVLKALIDIRREDGTKFINYANCQSEPNEEVVAILSGELRVFSELSDRAGNLDTEEVEKIEKIEGPIYCDQSWNLEHNILLPNGIVTLCCMDYSMVHILGNLLENKYEEILNSKEKLKVVESMKSKLDYDILCRKCIKAKKYLEF